MILRNLAVKPVRVRSMNAESIDLYMDVFYVIAIILFTLNAYRIFPFSDGYLGSRIGRWPRGFEKFLKIAGPLLIVIQLISFIY